MSNGYLPTFSKENLSDIMDPYPKENLSDIIVFPQLFKVGKVV